MSQLNITVPMPQVVVVYQTKDISAEIAPYLISVDYTDVLEGESDTVELTLEDVDGRWQNAWYPTHGDQLSLQIGYASQVLLPCGQFEIDEITLDGPPDVVKLKAIAAGVKRAVRTHNGRAYENTTLSNIAAMVAKRNKLKLTGNIEPIAINRVTQMYETDLTFLKRLGAEYGYSFSVRGNQLSFFKRAALKASKTVLSLHKSDLSNYSFTEKINGVVTGATVSYHDPHAKLTRIVVAQDGTTTSSKASKKTSADHLKLNVRAESDAQAKLKANAALEKRNEDQTTAEFSLEGNIKVMAGVNIDLAGFGKLNGKYHITQSKHSFSRSSGYATNFNAKRVRD